MGDKIWQIALPGTIEFQSNSTTYSRFNAMTVWSLACFLLFQCFAPPPSLEDERAMIIEVMVANQGAVASRSAEESLVGKLARFFPEATRVRIPVRVKAVRAGKSPEENTVIEFGTPEEVLFASTLPLEFEDKVQLENADGSLRAEASVVALQYQDGGTAVAARFLRPVANWIIKR